LLDAGFPGAPHAVVACGSAPHRSATLHALLLSSRATLPRATAVVGPRSRARDLLLLDAGFAGAPHAVVACGSVPHRSAALFGVIPSRSANYVAPQLVAQPLRPSASGACALKRRRKGWGFFLLLPSRTPQRDARCWRPGSLCGDLLSPVIPVTPPPTSQTLIAEIIKLCDIADTLGRAVLPTRRKRGA
jgi:hypothetical protein